jgi:hypothetical protein
MRNSNSRIKLKSARFEAGLCVYCGVQSHEPQKKGCIDCLQDKYRSQKELLNNYPNTQKIYHLKIRKEVLTKYGNKCVCCGEDKWPLLVIDHINNDGYQERRELYGSQSGSGGAFLLKLRREPIRKDLQVLCWSCNAAKSLYGCCPHNSLWVEPEIPDIDKRRTTTKNFKIKGKIVWPLIGDLVEMVLKSNCSEVARKLGVHNTALRGRLKRRGLYTIVQEHVKQKRNKETIS